LKITVKLFPGTPGLPEGQPQVVEVPDGATVGEVVMRLKAEVAAGAEWSRPVLIVNQAAVAWDTPLKDGDEVLVLWPLGGG
jgi:molybdopterin converting factor small subunit